jgi:hypothetical protein
MSADNVELTLRRQMHSRSAELEGLFGPAPDLASLLGASPQAAPAVRPARLRFAMAVAGAAVLLLAMSAGSFLYIKQGGGGPVSTVTPSASPSLLASSPTAAAVSPSLSTPSLTPLPSTSDSLGFGCPACQS